MTSNSVVDVDEVFEGMDRSDDGEDQVSSNELGAARIPEAPGAVVASQPEMTPVGDASIPPGVDRRETQHSASVDSDSSSSDERKQPASSSVAGQQQQQQEEDKEGFREPERSLSPFPAIPFARSALSAVSSIVDAFQSSSKTEDKNSSDNLPSNAEEDQQEAIRTVPSNNSTISSTSGLVHMENDEEQQQPAETPDIVPTSSKDSRDVISLPNLGTSTTVDSHEQQQQEPQKQLSSTDFGISIMASTEVDVDDLEADIDVDELVAAQQQQQAEEQQLAAAASNIDTTTSTSPPPQGNWNNLLTEDDLNEEQELKAGRSSSGDTDNDSTLMRDSSSSNTVQTADEAGTDTTYDTDGSLSTASAVIDDDDDDERQAGIDKNFSLVSPLMAEHDDDDDNSDSDDQDIDTQQHPIMPQQPELLLLSAAGVGIDAVPTTSGEEEKTEVDEYHPTKDDSDNMNNNIMDETTINTNGERIEELAALLPPDNNNNNNKPPSRRIRFEDDDDIPPIIDNHRAAYVSATILKREATLPHGLEFRRIDRELRIVRIADTGLFANTPLAPLDIVMRINDLNVEKLDPVNASHLLDVLTGSITVICHNRGGKKDLVESLITKPIQDSRTGMEFKMVTTDDELFKQELEIGRIGQKSLFSHSLLHVGDRVVSVNQCQDVDNKTADLLLSSALDHCVILARTKLKTKMAIARRPTHQLPPNFNFVRAMEEARRHREELRRKQGCYYNSCERPGACANIFQWLGNVYVITIVIVGVSISWSTVKEQTYDGSDAVGTILQFMGLFVGGILLGFLVNAPWWFRKVGARFSIAQLVCNVIVVVSFFLMILLFDSSDYGLSGYEYGIFFGLFFPLLIIVNLPSVFVKREDGSDGNTISDRDSSDDEMSLNSDGSDVV
ncbi:expressed unknown protein [Seminavis robusta]|uniref:PDZ domain-containing protein n=1 Tax=Seminavis robusta TaxID=568900 RepID=A0A9N8EVZ8_9STRA|nr:expressed unknown protein [Seminavis robusta]|eukprot:Sro1852_g301760.1 n/a (898) ;mRNA; r:14818-17511